MPDVQTLLGLSSPPIAIAFLEQAPDGVAAWDGPEVPAGCTFWRQAMNGKTFHTSPSHHYNCAVGSHTHGVSLPESRAGELMDAVGFMVSSGYIEMKEVPEIPVHKGPNRSIAFGPVDSVTFAPDVVIAAVHPTAGMMLYEAAVRAGVAGMAASILGRPGCAAVPMVEQSGQAALSFGCKGNRTFTGLPDGELYYFVPGAKWNAVVEQLGAILEANRVMEEHYCGKRAQFPILA